MINGLTSSDLAKPDYEIALIQHAAYIDALKECGLEVIILDADDDYPDSTFVEDTALLTPEFAVITRPGARSRRGETGAIENRLKDFFSHIERVEPPGTVDAGDIMMLGHHCYIGRSERTNSEGAEQIIQILKANGLTGSTIPLKDVLHLKSGVAYIENNNLVAAGEFIGRPEFERFNVIKVVDAERYAANCLWLNGTVLIPSGFTRTKRDIENFGYETIALDMSEFQKLDGGLSCLSLRF